MLLTHRWSHNLHQRSQWNSVLLSERIVTVERRSRLVRLDPSTGELLWEARVGGPWGWLAATASVIGYLNQHRLLQCFDANSGATLWESALGDGRGIYGRLVATEGYLMTGGWRGYTPLHCLDLFTGTELWSTPEPCDYAPTILGPWGLAISNPTSAELLLIETHTGIVQRRIPLPEGTRASAYSSSVQRYGSLLLATTKQGDLLLIDPVIDQAWRTLGFYTGGIFTVQPTLLGDWVLFQDTARQLCAFDLAAGRLLWSSPLLHRGERVQAVRLPRLWPFAICLPRVRCVL